eukprot:46545_1
MFRWYSNDIIKARDINSCYTNCIAKGWGDRSRCKYFGLGRNQDSNGYYDCYEYTECDTIIENNNLNIYKTRFTLNHALSWCYDQNIRLKDAKSPGECGQNCKVRADCEYFAFGVNNHCWWCASAPGTPPSLSYSDNAYVFSFRGDETYCSNLVKTNYLSPASK